MKKLKVAVSPLTNNIFAGSLLKNGRTWSADKQDVTIDCLVAVAQHVITFGSDVVIQTSEGVKEYEISVKKLN